MTTMFQEPLPRDNAFGDDKIPYPKREYLNEEEGDDKGSTKLSSAKTDGVPSSKRMRTLQVTINYWKTIKKL